MRADCRELLHPHGERGRLTGRLSCGYEYKEALKGDLAASSGAARRTQPVLPEDIRNLAHRLLRHRLILRFEAISAGVTPENVIDAVLHEQFVPLNETRRKAIDPLKDEVRRKGLWASHLGPELGGQGYGQLKLALLNEILGRSAWAPIVFGCQAPDTGNAEIIAHYGTDEQKERYLRPLLDGEIFSSYSMTEPQGGADPTHVQDPRRARRRRLGHQRREVLLLQRQDGVVPDRDGGDEPGCQPVPGHVDVPGADRHAGRRHRPQRRPVRRIVDDEGSHALIHYDNVRVPAEALLGGEGQAFVIAQTRLGGGRIHHAMRTIGLAQKALDMMCERALSRETAGSKLSDKQFVQGYIADSYGNSRSSGCSCSTPRGRSTSTTTTRRSARTSRR